MATGDGEATQECLDRHGGLVWSLARRWFVDAEAEDAVQEVFVDLWKNASRFDASRASEKTFIAMIARRRLIDRLRRTQRRLDVDPLPEGLGEPSGDQHERIEQSAEASIASRVFAGLKPVQRQTLQLSIVQGMSHSEIATATELPLGTVKSHIARGLREVRDALVAANRPVSPAFEGTREVAS